MPPRCSHSFYTFSDAFSRESGPRYKPGSRCAQGTAPTSLKYSLCTRYSRPPVYKLIKNTFLSSHGHSTFIMSVQNPSRIWESPSEPSNSPPQRNSNTVSKTGQLPSIAALTNDLPPTGPNGPASPQYSATNRSSDPWASQPQSTRKFRASFPPQLELASVQGEESCVFND